jgi:hypothetical protein
MILGLIRINKKVKKVLIENKKVKPTIIFKAMDSFY